MTEIKKRWCFLRSGLIPFPEKDLALIADTANSRLSETASCFWLFRYLHRFENPAAVLMGDYCFGRFSHHLAAIDSVELTNAFSAFLKDDTLYETDLDSYLGFIENASRMI